MSAVLLMLLWIHARGGNDHAPPSSKRRYGAGVVGRRGASTSSSRTTTTFAIPYSSRPNMMTSHRDIRRSSSMKRMRFAECGTSTTTPLLPLFYANPSSSSASADSPPSIAGGGTGATATTREIREMALQIMEENAMPPPHLHKSHPLVGEDDDGDAVRSHASRRGSEGDGIESGVDERGDYDIDHGTPLEVEFNGLICNFMTYTADDVRSLTSTSNLYHDRHPAVRRRSRRPMRPRHHQRTRDGGLKYRTLFHGVRCASTESSIIRAFTILFEDYLPIRLAGRRIYNHLSDVIEDVRELRNGEIYRAIELCPNWDDVEGSVGEDYGGGDGRESLMEYARCVWDTLMDESLLLEDDDDDTLDESTAVAVGVISLSMLTKMGIDEFLIEEGIVNDVTELESIVGTTVLQEERQIAEWDEQRGGVDNGNKRTDMTFVTFMKVMHVTMTRRRSEYGSEVIRKFLQRMERRVLDNRTMLFGGGHRNDDISALMAAMAVNTRSGTTKECEKRAKWSRRFDEYVSTFQLWERRFLNCNDEDDNDDGSTSNDDEWQKSRRFEILRGCFVGARNEGNVAALKIVYMDYAALRIGGDLIFGLMSKIADKII